MDPDTELFYISQVLCKFEHGTFYLKNGACRTKSKLLGFCAASTIFGTTIYAKNGRNWTVYNSKMKLKFKGCSELDRNTVANGRREEVILCSECSHSLASTVS